MANPFLMEDPVDYADTSAANSNPFLFGGGDQPFLMDPGTDNPFLSSVPSMTAAVPSTGGTNPFADYSWEEPKGHDPGLLTPPAISNINDPENDFVVSSDDEASKPRRPPPPRPSMPKETQDLILSVTGALKATSDHLLDRLPPTRAPSPTTFNDLHSPRSPSPSPDLLGGDDDLLSLAQQPPRPTPPRPPSRPAPPQPPPPQAVPPQLPSQTDMFDLFGTAPPPQPKSKDAILNLYSQPISQPKDLLSEDIDLPLQPSLISGGAVPSAIVNQVIDTQAIDNVETIATQPPQAEFSNAADESGFYGMDAQEIGEVTLEQESVPIFGTGSVITEPEAVAPVAIETIDNTVADIPFPVETQLESNHTLFGTDSISPEEQPQIFGTGAPPVQDQPSIFGSVPPPKPEPPQIFGSAPPPKPEPPQTFGSAPPPRPGPPPIPPMFNAGPPPKPEPPEIPNAGPPPKPAPPHIFGTAPPPRPEPHNIFAAPEIPDEPPQIFGTGPPLTSDAPEIFGTGSGPADGGYIFGTGPPLPDEAPQIFGVGPPEPEPRVDSFGGQQSAPFDAFDAFAAKFEQADDKKGGSNAFDPFGGSSDQTSIADAWGSEGGAAGMDQGGFGGDSFDTFLSMTQPPPAPQPTPIPMTRADSVDSEEGGFNVVIKPRGDTVPFTHTEGVPVLAPPPKSPVFAENDPRFNPFDKNGQIPAFPMQDGFQLPPLSQTEPYEGGFKRSDSQETPPTPLFDEDVSQPLEDFPRIKYIGDGWEMQLRQPNKKKITGQRFWKKIFVKLVFQGDNPVLQLFNLKEDKDPFQELPLQACYSVSEISAQQYDQYGKIFTVKIQYIFYKERPGVRPGQVTKAERITNKLSQFAAYAIQGDYQGVKEFGSDLKKLGLPVEHAPQISQLLKLGCMSYEDLKQFSVSIEEVLFRMPVHRDRALNYKMEEVQITVVDEMYVEQDAFGHVEKQIARVRLFFLAFLSGMPDVELGMNDLWRQGKEVVGRHDIIPVVTEEWIRLESVEFHTCVQLDEYEKTRTIKFKPPDACYIELMRFRVRPPKNRELPLQLKAVMCVTGNRVELRADVLVPGVTSRKLGLIPCEDVMIRFPIPECWIYLFRVEKHFRYGSVKSAHRRTGKIKGIERFLGAVENVEPSLMEVTSGQAKYEHQHRAIVWRMPRLPKDGQGAYTTHNLVCRMQLTSYDQIPDTLAEYAYIEFTMPATTASHTTVRSVSLVDSDSDAPPEKYVRQLARLEYRVGIEHTQGEEMASYIAATATKPKPPTESAPAPAPAPSPLPADSDSDSSG